MNKIKLALIATAILVSVGGAFATKPCYQCEHSLQYIPSGTGFAEVGEFGVDYDCEFSGGTCTYYRPDPAQPNYYAPCRTGAYVEIN